MKSFVYNRRVYFRDTDAGGVVYHANYLAFAEEARTQALLSLSEDFSNVAMMQKGEVFVVVHCEVDFIKSAKLDDQLVIYSNVLKLAPASAVFLQNIMKNDTLLAKLKVKVAAINMASGRPISFNPKLKELLKQYIKTEE